MILKKKHDDGSYIQMKVDQDATWMQATDSFLSFLHACGYVFDSIEVGEHIVEQWSFQRPRPETLPEEWVDQPRSEIKRKKRKKRAK